MSRPVGGVLSSCGLITCKMGSHPSKRSTEGPSGRHRTTDGPPAGTGRATHIPILTLLRVGFTEPVELPRPLVRSYRTLSPLPVRPVEP